MTGVRWICLALVGPRNRLPCAFDNPLCASLYEDCACDYNTDMDGTMLDQYRMRAERLLLDGSRGTAAPDLYSPIVAAFPDCCHAMLQTVSL